MRKLLASFILISFFGLNLIHAQNEGPLVPGKIKLNGNLDNLHEFSTLVTVPVEMPDGVKLMTDIFLPMTQDCMSVVFTPADLDEAIGSPGVGDLLTNGKDSVRIELIPRGAQLFVYDSIWSKTENKRVLNPDPYSLPMILTRTPYDKTGDETGRIITIFGYAYAMQDMRGRYSSEGVYFPMYSDSWNKNPYHSNFKHILDYTAMDDPKNGNRHEDGYNTIKYLSQQIDEVKDFSDALTNWTLIDVLQKSNQNGANDYLIALLKDKNKDGKLDTFNICNGSLGMFGASALGNTQYQAAGAHKINPFGSGLKSLMPIVATNEHYRYTGYQNGVFRERIVTGWLKGQIFDIEDQEDLAEEDEDRQNNIHTADDYDLPKVLTINNRTRMYFPDKFDASTLAIDHFVRMRYPDDKGNESFPGYYPNSPGRGDMDASFSQVDENGESVMKGKIVNGKVVDVPDSDPDGILGFGNTPRPNLTYSRYRNKDVPTYHLTGWWDIFTDGQIETWRLMREHVTETDPNLQKLVIGPWAHQTIGGTKTGDMIYPENCTDVLGFDIGDVDIEDLDVEKILQSEIVSWFRYNLNYNGYKNIGLPNVVLPKGRVQELPTALGNLRLTIPAQNYQVKFIDFINYINGSGKLDSLPVALDVDTALAGLLGTLTGGSPTTHAVIQFDLPQLKSQLIPEFSGEKIAALVDSINFGNTNRVPNVRLYVVGPVNDGINGPEVGNYWFESDSFPLNEKKYDIRWEKMYMHKDGKLDNVAPIEDEGYSIYVHDPDDPVASIGGANMIVSLPDGYDNKAEHNDDSHGQVELTDPRWMHTTMDREGVISFETERLYDPLTVIGFPKVKLYAKSNPGGVTEGPTDTDFFVRVVDVYPDGREYFVVEGCVNARARDYAAYIAEHSGLEDWNIPFTNINIGQIYEYYFRTMPIAYTWGVGHKIKILISSSNHTRYQVNPNLPMQEGDFFRRVPKDGQTYVFNGKEMEPRIAIQRIAHSDKYPSYIELPFYEKTYTSTGPEQIVADFDALVYPNPATNKVNVYMSQPDDYKLVVNNSLGQQIFSTDFSDNITLDATKWDKGFYILEIIDAKATKRITKKVTIM